MKYICIVSLCVLLSACAMNRVDDVESSIDTFSFYKVPVVYGSGVRDGPSFHRMSMTFMEFDPHTNSGTGTCLGFADQIQISFGGTPDNPQDNKMHYHVLMVPPGFYALSMGTIAPNEALPSVYFEVNNNGPQYLGDFWIQNTNEPYSGVAADPVEYNSVKAVDALMSFGISVSFLRVIDLMPTEAHSGLLCTP